MALPVFKTGVGFFKISGGFDSHPPPPLRLGFRLSVFGILMRRILQPPVDPALRDREHHTFWLPFIGSAVCVVLIFCGARHLTGIETVDGSTAWETQLVKAYASGGLKYAEVSSAPPAPVPGDPTATALALERWERQKMSEASGPRKVRVDTAAATPCPT